MDLESSTNKEEPLFWGFSKKTLVVAGIVVGILLLAGVGYKIYYTKNNVTQKSTDAGNSNSKIIVKLKVKEGICNPDTFTESCQNEIARVQQALLSELKGKEHKVNRLYTTIPFIALEVSPSVFEVVKKSSLVENIEQDKLRSTTSNSEANTTPDQRAYKNATYGFELEYPFDSYRTKYYSEKSVLPTSFDKFAASFSYYCPETLPESMPVLTFTVGVHVADNPSRLPVNEFVLKYEKDIVSQAKQQDEWGKIEEAIKNQSKEIIAGGLQGVRVKDFPANILLGTEGGKVKEKVYLSKGSEVYILESSWDGQDSVAQSATGLPCFEKRGSIFDRVISSLKFTK